MTTTDDKPTGFEPIADLAISLHRKSHTLTVDALTNSKLDSVSGILEYAGSIEEHNEMPRIRVQMLLVYSLMGMAEGVAHMAREYGLKVVIVDDELTL